MSTYPRSMEAIKKFPSGGEVPPMVLQPGEYEASEPAVFTLTQPGVR